MAPRPTHRAAMIALTIVFVPRVIGQLVNHPEDRWFTGTIPIWFHMVLALFVYVWGRHHLTGLTRSR